MRRRDALRHLATAALAACHGGRRAAPRDGGPVAAPTPPPVDGHLDALDRAVAAAGGLDFVARGDVVILKVNTNSGDPYPYSTSPAVVAHLATQLADRGARVIVGDRSFFGDLDTAGNLERNGIAPAARRAGAEVVVFDEDVLDWDEIDPALVPSWTPPVRLPRLVVEADHVLNLACAKTHFIAGCTLGLKNFLGLVHAGDRARPGNLRTHDPDRVHDQIVEIHRALRPKLSVIDGFRALVSGGPTPDSGAEPTIVETGVIIVDRDRIAAELAGIALLQRHAPATEAVHDHAPDDHPTIVAARRAGVS